MSAQRFFIDGQPVCLAKLLGKGGEGEVYAIADQPDVALKVYTVGDTADRQSKIKAMIKNKLAEHAKLVAFPKSVVTRKDGRFAGFTMQLVRQHKPLYELYAPGARKLSFPKADYRFLVRAAANVALAVAQIHSTRCVIGDINHSGILISPAAVAAFIDADSFQFSDGAEHHFCFVGVPEYTPPELQGQSFGKKLRTRDHDAFGLAVVIFQLLFMGRHPYIGTYAEGDIALHKAIAEHRFAYSLKRGVGMTPPPGAGTLTDVPKALRQLFELAFATDRAQPRPSARQWAEALLKSEAELILCKANPLHYIFQPAQRCPWCHMEKELGVALFLPNLSPVLTFQTGAFLIEQFWNEIQAIKFPDPDKMMPVVPNKAIKPSWRARLFKWRQSYWRSKPTHFLNHHMRAAEDWNTALKNWREASVASRLKATMQKLDTAHHAFVSLKTNVETHLKEAHADKHQPEIKDHLSQFNIGQAKLKGLGQAKVFLLGSYGVETAADVSEDNIKIIPGFGRANTDTLLTWRAELERKHTYVVKPQSVDMSAVRRIHSDVQVQAADLQKHLQHQKSELEHLAPALVLYRTTLNKQITKAYRAKQQALVDLKYLDVELR